MFVSVAVATIWTSPESPRERDLPAIQNTVELTKWIGAMTVEDRLQLWSDNLVQTQVLYGEHVIVEEERGDWAQVIIPSQESRKDQRGYPGWMPRCQLCEGKEMPAIDRKAAVPIAVVSAKTAFLYSMDQTREMELSFGTRLPLLAQEEEWVKVATPHGPRMLRAEEVKISGAQPKLGPAVGEQIAKTAAMFIGLHYLWSGLSSFGYDCSGFAYSMHRQYGILIPRDASDQARAGKIVEKEELKPGDLLFFAYEEGKGRVHHVGIYYGENRMIHSPDSHHAIEVVSLADYKLKHEHAISRRYW